MGSAHETLGPQRQIEYSGSNAMAQADAFVDRANNKIGRDIAGDNPNASPQQLALKVLDQFHQIGLWTAQQNPDGSVSIGFTQITIQQYAHAKQVITGFNDNGYTQAEQQQHNADAARQFQEMQRWMKRGWDE